MNVRRKGDHDEVDALLPWFINGSLAARDERLVLSHLHECAECREERDRLQEIGRFLAEDDDGGQPDYRFAFGRLMHRIEAHEANLASTRDLNPPPRFMHRTLSYAALATLLVATVVVVIALNPGAGEPAVSAGGEYRTLTTTGAASGDSRRLALTFEQPAGGDVIRSALIESRSTIVSGPDEEGTWIVEVDMPASVSPESFLESLRQIEGVRHAAFDPGREEP